jgi:hypothetical protein
MPLWSIWAGQQEEIRLAWIEGQGAVVEGIERLGALEHAAVDEEAALGMADAVAGAGHGPGGAVEVEGDAHGMLFDRCGVAGATRRDRPSRQLELATTGA